MIWWKDTDTNLTSTEQHPINAWKNSTRGAIRGVHPSTSLGYTTYLYAQMADRAMQGFNISYEAENTHTFEDGMFTVTDPAGPAKGLAGTHLTMTAYEEKDGMVRRCGVVFMCFIKWRVMILLLSRED